MTSQEKVRRVTIADDDDDDFMFFSIACEELPYTMKLSRAINGDALLKSLEKYTPDLLFLDIMMPCKDGRDCLKEIRADRRFDSMPVIMYTSFKDKNNIEFCLHKGANFYIIKPNSVEELKNVIQRIFSMDWRKTFAAPTHDEFVLR